MTGAPFDGERYSNVADVQVRGLGDVLKWQMKGEKRKWPKWVENTVRAVLPANLGKGQVHVTFINHATVLVQTAEFNFLTDPVWSKRVSPFSFVGPARVRAPGLDFAKLPQIHAVFVSHNHYDHLDLETLKQLNQKFAPQFYVAKGDLQLLQKNGITRAYEMDWWDQLKQGPVDITYLPSQHWSARGTFDRCKSLWGSFGISVEGKHIYFAGDTGYSPHFTQIREQWGAPDLALLPIGAYSPRWFMRDFHMDPDDSVRAFLDLRARHAMAIHFGTWQLTDEGLTEPVEDLQAALAKHQVPPERFFVLPQGGGWDLKD